MRHRVAVLLLAGPLLAAAPMAEAGLFSSPPPEMIYNGAGPGLSEGVTVIRDAEALDAALAPLDPAFGGQRPDMKKVTVLRIVGRARENRCRDTALLEVTTKGMSATAKLEERVGAPKCPCPPDARPPRVFLVTVSRWVREATVDTRDTAVPCTAPAAPKQQPEAAGKPAMLFEGSWNEPSGVKVIVDTAAYREVVEKLGLADRGPAVDFNKDRVVVVTGRARENACRKTKVVDARLVGKEEVVFDVDETYAATGQMCAQVVMLPQVFLYRVPSTVMTARAVTREVR